MKKNLVFFLFILAFAVPSLRAQENINQFDSEGRRHGIWKQYYPNTKKPQLRYEGKFHHGKEIGEFRFYCEDCGNTPNVIKSFNPKNDIAEVKFFDNGKLISEGKMDGKIHIGKWIYYHKNASSIMTEENYERDKLHGLKRTFYPDGKIAEEQHYKNGIQEGEEKYYSSEGVLLRKLFYKNGKLHGPAVYYDTKGKKLIEGQYKQGMKDGKWRYYENGEVREEQFPKH